MRGSIPRVGFLKTKPKEIVPKGCSKGGFQRGVPKRFKGSKVSNLHTSPLPRAFEGLLPRDAHGESALPAEDEGWQGKGLSGDVAYSSSFFPVSSSQMIWAHVDGP